jgi:hypothetical protein
MQMLVRIAPSRIVGQSACEPRVKILDRHLDEVSGPLNLPLVQQVCDRNHRSGHDQEDQRQNAGKTRQRASYKPSILPHLLPPGTEGGGEK